jgi:DNA-binding phage protein
MALTRSYRETVVKRIQGDPAFARALYAEAVASILGGETAVGLSQLRDIVHALVTFPELARVTGVPEKSLHRALSAHGNPRASTLGKVVVGIRESLGFIPQVSVATA